VNAKVCPVDLSLTTNGNRTEVNLTEAVVSRRKPRDNHSTGTSGHQEVSSVGDLEDTQKMMA
jgi:hypothetical protein